MARRIVRRYPAVGFFLFAAGGVVAGLFLAAALRRPSGEALRPTAACARPNILLVTLDTIRTERMSCYDYFRPTTPNLDALSLHATRFVNASTPMPFTAPAHASMLTGLYPTAHGVTENAIPPSEQPPMLPAILQERGYSTASVVAVRFLAEFGLDRGFAWVDRDFGSNTVRSADDVTQRSIQWLQNRPPDAPFFLWAHYYDPHEPYRPPARFQPLLPPEHRDDEPLPDEVAEQLKTELRADQPPFNPEEPSAYLRNQYAYDGEIEFADEQIGELLRHLQRRGLYDSTLIVVAGDHGEAFGEHPGDIQHGYRLYQATQRVPLLIKLPGQTSGMTVSSVVSLVDLLPTILDWLGVPIPDHLHGESLYPLLRGEEPSPSLAQRIVFMERRRNRPALPGQTAAEVRPEHRCFDVGMYAVQGPRWKLIWEEGSSPELYDLTMDADECHDVADLFPEQVARLHRVLITQNARNREQAVAAQAAVPDPDVVEMLRGLGYLKPDPPTSRAP